MVTSLALMSCLLQAWMCVPAHLSLAACLQHHHSIHSVDQVKPDLLRALAPLSSTKHLHHAEKTRPTHPHAPLRTQAAPTKNRPHNTGQTVYLFPGMPESPIFLASMAL